MLLMGLGFAAMMPSVNSWVSKRGVPEQQGMNMGIVNAFSSLGRVFGPIAGGMIFDLIGPQWPYLVGAGIFFIALLFAHVQFRRDARVHPRPMSISAG